MTAPRPPVSEHTDAARLEALRDSMRPRVEGEAVLRSALRELNDVPWDRLYGLEGDVSEDEFAAMFRAAWKVQRRVRADVEAALSEVSRLTAEVERGNAVELRYRKELWLNHGHDHLYGDDGEMQCTQCSALAWDYRRAPLEVIERAVWEARAARLAALALPTNAEPEVKNDQS